VKRAKRVPVPAVDPVPSRYTGVDVLRDVGEALDDHLAELDRGPAPEGWLPWVRPPVRSVLVEAPPAVLARQPHPIIADAVAEWETLHAQARAARDREVWAADIAAEIVAGFQWRAAYEAHVRRRLGLPPPIEAAQT
jgi:hypothetical protein